MKEDVKDTTERIMKEEIIDKLDKALLGIMQVYVTEMSDGFIEPEPEQIRIMQSSIKRLIEVKQTLLQFHIASNVIIEEFLED